MKNDGGVLTNGSDGSCLVWCTICGYRFNNNSDMDEPTCPKCGMDPNKHFPCSANMDFTIDINLHELRMLTIWASNYAAEKKSESKGLAGIIHRLRQQLPDDCALTMEDEFRMLRNEFGKIEVHGSNPKGPGLVPVHGLGAVGHGKRFDGSVE